MGTWGTSLFANDTTCDVKDTYLMFLSQLSNHEKAFQKTYETYKELIGGDEEALFWYAVADVQWNWGYLMPQVRDTALRFIEQKTDTSFWDNSKQISKWEKSLQKLRQKLVSPTPTMKNIKPQPSFIRNPWEIGDVYAYQFHTTQAQNCGLFGKYILFQKIGNVEYYAKIVFSVVQVYDQVFDALPTVNDIKNTRILPLVNPLNSDEPSLPLSNYIPSFEWYKKATMIYENKSEYPSNHLTFVGNQPIEERTFAPNTLTDFFWDKNQMEEWLIEYYLNWKNVNY